MAKSHKPEEIIGKLPEAEIVLAQVISDGLKAVTSRVFRLNFPFKHQTKRS